MRKVRRVREGRRKTHRRGAETQRKEDAEFYATGPWWSGIGNSCGGYDCGALPDGRASVGAAYRTLRSFRREKQPEKLAADTR